MTIISVCQLLVYKTRVFDSIGPNLTKMASDVVYDVKIIPFTRLGVNLTGFRTMGYE